MTAPGEQPEERLDRTGTQARSAAGNTQEDGSLLSQDWADVIGPNATDYYLGQFRRIQGGNRYSWHWPAFFVTLGWLFYRKLWLPGFTYLMLLPLGLAVILSLAARLLGELGIIVAYALVFSLTFFVIPLFANRVYFAKVQRTVARVDAGNDCDAGRRARLRGRGGTHLLLAILTMLIPGVVTLLLIAASIPAYRDFAARSEVMEGLELAGRAQAAIADHYREHAVWPADNAAAGIAAARDLRGRCVDSIAIDGGVIVVTYGQSGQRVLHGKQLILNPDADRLPAIEWICYSPDIPSRLLPAGCEAPDLR